jgi:hypothetical protein
MVTVALPCLSRDCIPVPSELSRIARHSPYSGVARRRISASEFKLATFGCTTLVLFRVPGWNHPGMLSSRTRAASALAQSGGVWRFCIPTYASLPRLRHMGASELTNIAEREVARRSGSRKRCGGQHHEQTSRRPTRREHNDDELLQQDAIQQQNSSASLLPMANKGNPDPVNQTLEQGCSTESEATQGEENGTMLDASHWCGGFAKSNGHWPQNDDMVKFIQHVQQNAITSQAKPRELITQLKESQPAIQLAG